MDLRQQPNFFKINLTFLLTLPLNSKLLFLFKDSIQFTYELYILQYCKLYLYHRNNFQVPIYALFKELLRKEYRQQLNAKKIPHKKIKLFKYINIEFYRIYILS